MTIFWVVGDDWGWLGMIGGDWGWLHVLVKPVCLLNKSPQRGRDGTHGNEVGTLRRDRNIDR